MIVGNSSIRAYTLGAFLCLSLGNSLDAFSADTIVQCNIFGTNIRVIGGFNCNSKEVLEKIRKLEEEITTKVGKAEFVLLLKRLAAFEERVQSNLQNVSELEENIRKANKDQIEDALGKYNTVLNQIGTDLYEESKRRDADITRLQETLNSFDDIIDIKIQRNNSEIIALQGSINEVEKTFIKRADEMDLKYQMIMRELKLGKKHLTFIGGGFGGFNTESFTRENWLIQYDARLEHFFPAQNFPPAVTIGYSKVDWPLKKSFPTFSELDKVSYVQDLSFDFFDVGLNFLTPVSKNDIRWFAGGSAGYSLNDHVNWILSLRGGIEYYFPKIRVIAEIRYQYLNNVTQEERTFNPFGDTFRENIQSDEKFFMIGTRILYGI